MNKNYTKLLSTIAGVLLGASAIAQPINENFQNVPNLFTSGWAQQNLSSPIGTLSWFQGNPSVFVANSAPDSSYIGVNFNSGSGTATLSNWLFAPTRTFNNGDVITFRTRTDVNPTTFPDRLELRLSTNGTSTNVGSTSTSVGDFTTVLVTVNSALTSTGYPATWTLYTATISGLSSPTSGRVAFRYFVTNGGPGGANSNYIGIDDFVYTPAGTNVTVTNPARQYTIIPISQIAPIPLQARLNNTGTSNITDGTITVSVFQAPNFSTPVFTQTSSNTSLAAGANSLISLGNYTPPATPASYLIRYISSCTNNIVTSADTANYVFSIDNKVYGRDDGNVTFIAGIGAGPTGYIGSMYTFTTATEIDSVLFANSPSGTSVGDSVKVVVYNVSGGLPNAIIGRSAARIITAADTVGLNVIQLKVNALNGGPLQLAPGTYFVSIAEHNTNMSLAFCDNIFLNNTFYAGWTNQPFTALEMFPAQFHKAPVIRPILKSCTNTVATDVRTACGSYTWINGQTYTTNNNTATHVIPNAAGCDSTITLNLTITPLDNASFNYPSNTICSGGPNPTPTVNTSGNFSSVPSGLVFVNTATGEINVGASSTGTYTVTYTTTGSCPNTSSQSITITTAPDASFSYANNSYCPTATNPSPTFGPGASGGVFSASPSGLSINSSTGQINLAASTAGTYTVTNSIAASGSCPATSATATVTVHPATNIVVTPSSPSICIGNTTNLVASNASTYTWSPSTGLNQTTGSSVLANPTINTTYTITGTDANGCTGTVNVTVTVNALPTISVSPASATICNGASTSLIASGGSTYVWTPTTGLSSSTSANVTANPTATTTYTVSGTDANSCSNTTTVTVTVNPLPTVTFTLSNTNVCSTAAPFALSGGSPAGGTYTGAGVSGGQFNPATAGVGTHTITYTFTDANNCSASATQNITVSVCSGMEESSIANSLLIAPNPAREQLMISFNNAKSSNVQVNIISADGKLVYSENAAAASQYVKYVDVTPFAKGLYFIQILSEEGMIHNKIIVQ